MAQAVYIFQMPCSTAETVEIISGVVTNIGILKTKDPVSGMVVGKWRQAVNSGFLFDKKISFYIERNEVSCKVRAVMDGVDGTSATTAAQNSNKTLNTKVTYSDYVWDVFVQGIMVMYPGLNLNLSPIVAKEPLKVVYVIDKSSGREMVYSSRTTGGTSAAGFLLGGMMFGEAGAVVGGLSGTKRTTTSGRETYSSNVLMTVVFSNGRMQEGKIKKKSPLYHEIMVNFQSMPLG